MTDSGFILLKAVDTEVYVSGSTRFESVYSRCALSNPDFATCALLFIVIGELVVRSLGVLLEMFVFALVDEKAVCGTGPAV